MPPALESVEESSPDLQGGLTITKLFRYRPVKDNIHMTVTCVAKQVDDAGEEIYEGGSAYDRKKIASQFML